MEAGGSEWQQRSERIREGETERALAEQAFPSRCAGGDASHRDEDLRCKSSSIADL